MPEPVNNRYEFAYFFDVEFGNPNGDPDAGNMPRIDYETNTGLVTDVCLKRKIRNYVDLVASERSDRQRLNIYVRERSVLNRAHEEGWKAIGEKPADRLPKDAKKAESLTGWMCEHYFDIRTFGAVMTTEVNCGQVRGPVQFSFARSHDRVTAQEISVTRMAVTNDRDLDKERTMGRKWVVPYGLYRADGFISAALAKKTNFTSEDLSLLWEALERMFDHDRSAARGLMAARALVVFRHDSPLGTAPAHALLARVKSVRIGDAESPPRSFSQYQIVVDENELPAGVAIERRF